MTLVRVGRQKLMRGGRAGRGGRGERGGRGRRGRGRGGGGGGGGGIRRGRGGGGRGEGRTGSRGNQNVDFSNSTSTPLEVILTSEIFEKGASGRYSIAM